MTATLIDGTSIAAEVRAEVGEVVKEMRAKHGISPGLAVVLIGDDPASAVYVRMKERAAIEAGMVSETVSISPLTPRRTRLSPSCSASTTTPDTTAFSSSCPCPTRLTRTP